MTRAPRHARTAALASAALLLASCTGDCRGGHEAPARAPGQDARHHTWRPHAAPPARLGDLPAATPRWHVTLGPPPPAPAEHVAGPVIAPGTPAPPVVLLASSTIGVTAIAADTGAVRWQRTEEQAPGTPLVAPDNSGALWLPGRCAHRRNKRSNPDRPHPSNEHLLGCVETVDPTGTTIARTWIRTNKRALHTTASRHSRALDRRGPNLLWAHGPDLLSFNIPTGHVAGHHRALPPDEQTNHFPGPSDIAITGFLDHGSHLAVATTAGLAVFSACPTQNACTPAWHLPWPRAAGVAGPVPAGSNLAWVRDHTLQAGASGDIAWTAPGFHAYAPGSLAYTDAGMLLALRLSSEGIRPVRIEPSNGQVVDEGAAVPGIQVLIATSWARGMAAVVRLDKGLRHDAVVAWDTALRVRWAWMLPLPPRPRIEPVGLSALASSDSGVPGLIVFYGGRHAARLPLPAP